MRVSAVIIAGNEEAKIADAVRSVLWADEVLLIDSHSTDRTREIAEGLGARVIVRDWPGFSAQKRFAVEEAVNDWIFSLDADERVSPELQQELSQIITSGAEPGAAAFRIPRLTIYMGRPVRHSGWYPDHQIRFFDRRLASWSDDLVHESVVVRDNETLSTLSGEIIHLSVDDAAHHHHMIGTRYAPLAARQMFERGRRTSRFRVFTAGPAAFVRSYVLKGGFLDGLPGYCIARFAAHHAFLKNVMLWEMQQSAIDKSTT